MVSIRATLEDSGAYRRERDPAAGRVVKPPPFGYCAAETIEEAVDALGRYGADAKVLAGGQSLVPLMNLHLARPAVIIDVNGINALSGIHRGPDSESVVIGAGTRQRQAERDPIVAEALPLLAEAVGLVGHDAIRTRGTIGGSAAHADPAAEIPAVLVALGATMTARSTRGTRYIDADSFFQGFLTTELADDELLVSVELPTRRPHSGHAFVEFARRHGDFAVVGVAASLELLEPGIISDARIVLCGVDSIPVRARDAEAMLNGSVPGAEVFEAVAAEAARGLEPPNDGHGTSAYRSLLVRTLVAKALSTATARVEGAR